MHEEYHGDEEQFILSVRAQFREAHMRASGSGYSVRGDHPLNCPMILLVTLKAYNSTHFE